MLSNDVFQMPDNPWDFIAQLSRRKFWREIDARLLCDIAKNADGEIELLRNFVFVSEQNDLVKDNFVSLANNPEDVFGSPLSAFALTLYNLGSRLCKQNFLFRDFKLRGSILVEADMAFTSAILCDPLLLSSYAGMAFFYGDILIPKTVALEWCQKYIDAEDALLATPDERLTPFQQSAKKMIQNPNEEEKCTKEMVKYAPLLRIWIPPGKNPP